MPLHCSLALVNTFSPSPKVNMARRYSPHATIPDSQEDAMFLEFTSPPRSPSPDGDNIGPAHGGPAELPPGDADAPANSSKDDADEVEQNAHSQLISAVAFGAAQAPSPADWDPQIDSPDVFRLTKSIPQDGYVPLIDAIWDDEIRVDNALTRAPSDDALTYRYFFREQAADTLASMPEELIKILTAGNIAAKQSTEIETYLNDMTLLANRMPTIYVRAFVDQNNESPSVECVSEIADCLTAYCQPRFPSDVYHQNFIYAFEKRLDKSSQKVQVRSGHRHFRTDFMEKLLVWSMYLKRRCQRVPRDKWKDPLPDPPITYTGYSKQSLQRLYSHKKSQTSKFNRILEIIFGMAKTGQLKYSFHDRVICVLGEPQQCALAEITIAALARSNYRYGGTCSGAPGNQMGKVLEANDSMWDTDAIAAKTPILENWATGARLVRAYAERTDDVK